ncbi:very short patch repair endonuclease [Salinibacterium hongtaonis]|uniref:Very short patch repair endonuclease n=1 Tax=Homoserinimonas hongtaonis TaxID=2079791 RepID=A0A2U1SZT5_9MICO|nr:very short patch repair endonuclease [Salinibacterium hongtaonis]PWB97130.1 very short patch repair endonuclease [Salinibacterium hongtaonis]
MNNSSWASSGRARRVMQGNRSRDSKPEFAVRSAAHALGLRYKVVVRPIPGIRRTADMVFPREKVAVFVDGCSWHGCPIHFVPPKSNVEYWTAKIARNLERDLETNRLLTEASWQVIRIWSHEDPARAAQELRKTIFRRRRGA